METSSFTWTIDKKFLSETRVINAQDERLNELRSQFQHAKRLDLDKYIRKEIISEVVNEIFVKTKEMKRSKKKRDAYELIIANALCSKGMLSLSTGDKFYQKLPNRYNPRSINGISLRGAISKLQEYQYVDFFRGFSYAHNSCISKLKIEKKFSKMFDKFDLSEKYVEIHPDSEIIFLKDSSKKLIDYDDEDGVVRNARDFLANYNNFLESAKLSLKTNNQDFFRERVQLKRIFNSASFDLGGRFYSDFQNLKKDQRKYLRINDEPCVEMDYSGIHINMLYIEETGDVYKDGDVYRIKGFVRKRKLMKVLLQIALNAKTRGKGEAAFRFHLMEKGIKLDYKRALDLFDKKHLAISNHFYTGAGLRLQNLDSIIAEDVMRKCFERNIIGLPVHDSFIVQEKHRDFLEKAMIDSSREILGKELGVD